MKDIGSKVGLESFEGQEYDGGNARDVHRDIPEPPSLRDGGALRGACRSRPMSVCCGPLLMDGLKMRQGCIRDRSMVSNSAR